ncbi:MAG: hypothetical protein FJZ00_05340 [Candidatus Sericytochromatia bacterium]|uniref:BIG2 domain-containing protein n=1 Tax=Candidatus Tanganyikabacteria bacterium TaxID=2961651 RepID=A0A937X4C3_9BACT|nr:hypothetical protein [Candidatus Tanganyikabacteria bacterium]
MVYASARFLVALLAFVVAGCTVDLAGLLGDQTPAPSRSTSPAARSGGHANVTGSQAADLTVKGVVLGLDGRPAPGVKVSAYDTVASGLISNNSGSLSQGAALVGNNAASYRAARFRRILAQPALAVTTDASGSFRFVTEGTRSLNVEAVLSDTVKALKFDLSAQAGAVTLQLAYTGAISGQVTSTDKGVTDFLGTQVFVPGTGYLALTDAGGRFEISGVPPGTFILAAISADLGRGFANGITVESKKTASAPSLVLSTVSPVLDSVAPVSAAPGQTIRLIGRNFGVSAGKRPEISFNGLAVTAGDATDTGLAAQVPNGAVSGSIIVKVGSVASNPLPFAVAAALRLPAADTLMQGLTRRYLLDAADGTGKAVPGLIGIWSTTDAAVAAVSATGEVSALRPGKAAVSVAAGTLTAALSLEVVPPVDRLVLDPSSVPPLGPLPSPGDGQSGGGFLAAATDSVRFKAIAHFKEGGTAQLPVVWNLPDSRFTMSPDGLLRVLPGSEAGSATLRATLQANPAIGADVTVDVVRQGELAVVVE